MYVRHHIIKYHDMLECDVKCMISCCACKTDLTTVDGQTRLTIAGGQTLLTTAGGQTRLTAGGQTRLTTAGGQTRVTTAGGQTAGADDAPIWSNRRRPRTRALPIITGHYISSSTITICHQIGHHLSSRAGISFADPRRCALGHFTDP